MSSPFIICEKTSIIGKSSIKHHEIPVVNVRTPSSSTTSIPDAENKCIIFKDKKISFPDPYTRNITREEGKDVGMCTLTNPTLATTLQIHCKMTNSPSSYVPDHLNKKNLTSVQSSPNTILHAPIVVNSLMDRINRKVTAENTTNIDILSSTTWPKTPSLDSFLQKQGQNWSFSHSLQNPCVDDAVRSILTLVQTYGPLSEAQLNYNMPNLNPKYSLIQILNILVLLGVLHRVKVTSPTITNICSNKKSDTDKSKTKNSINKSGTIDKYFFHNGMPRSTGDIIFPKNLIQTIKDANLEIDRSISRINLLKKALEDALPSQKKQGDRHWGQFVEDKVYHHNVNEDNSNDYSKQEDCSLSNMSMDQPSSFHHHTYWNSRRQRPPPSGAERTSDARKLLLRLLSDFPEIVCDPIYSAAFSCLGINNKEVRGHEEENKYIDNNKSQVVKVNICVSERKEEAHEKGDFILENSIKNYKYPNSGITEKIDSFTKGEFSKYGIQNSFSIKRRKTKDN